MSSATRLAGTLDPIRRIKPATAISQSSVEIGAVNSCFAAGAISMNESAGSVAAFATVRETVITFWARAASEIPDARSRRALGHRRDVGARDARFGQDQILRRSRRDAPRSRRTCLQRVQNMIRSMLSHVSRLMMITPEQIRSGTRRLAREGVRRRTVWLTPGIATVP